MNKTLKKDLYSKSNKKHCYGKQGDEVKVVNQNHGEIIIVSDAHGNRFPVHKDDLE
jgi:hypothetical protein